MVVARTRVAGELFVIDLDENQVRNRFEFSGEAAGVAVADDGTIFVADPGASLVRRFSPFGQELRAIGSAGAQPRDRRALPAHPSAVCLATEDQLWVTCGHRPWVHGLQVFSPAGRFVSSVAAFGDRQRTFGPATGLCFDGEFIWVADHGNGCLQQFRRDTGFVGKFELDAPPLCVARCREGLAVVLEVARDACRILDRHMKTVCRVAGDFGMPAGLATSADQSLLILDAAASRVWRFEERGRPAETVLEL
jgi:hypothetical protein